MELSQLVKWINVKEALPAEFGIYLVVFNRNDRRLKKQRLVRQAWFTVSDRSWEVDSPPWDEKRNPTVTHWMPLPNLPKD